MARFIAFDVETPNAANNRISAIGISVVEDGRIVDSFYSLVNPECRFDPFNIQLTGIRPEMVQDAPTFPALWEKIEPLMSSGTLVAHNAVFDLGVLKACLRAYGISWKPSVRYLCTVQIGRKLLPGKSHRLNALSDLFGLSLNHHQADSDSQACAGILLKYMEMGNEWKNFYRAYSLTGTDADAAPEGSEAGAERIPSGTRSGKNPIEPGYQGKKPEETVSVGTSVKNNAAEQATPAGETLEKAAAGPAALAGETILRAQRVLSEVFGYSEFREGQEKIIRDLMAGRDVLGVMPTGSGKSICYQIPALLLPGTTIVISPLISLMKDQVSALRGRGIAAACLNSATGEREYGELLRLADSGRLKLLYVAPERLRVPGFVALCRRLTVPLLAVDEAHCISQWGQDFRPSYLKIPELVEALPARPVIGAFTATATPQVQRDITKHLRLTDPETVITGYDRPNLTYSVYEPRDREEKLLGLLRDRFHQSGIVYCATRKNVESVYALLIREGFPATRYHAGLEQKERMENQEDFLFDRKRVMVATNAFGMGIDKSNVSYVIHFNMPKSLEAYYQEAGRAGRDGCEADCILLYAGQDVITGRWLIEHSDPNPELTPEEQAEVRSKEEERLKQMAFYSKSRKCLRAFILRYFGEKAPDRCENCSNCVGECLHVDITRQAQMILSHIVRTGQRLGEKDAAELLRGIVPEGYAGEDPEKELTTFGLMKAETEEQVLRWIRALTRQGYLEKAEDGTGILKLTESSKEVLFRQRRVLILQRSAAGEAANGEDVSGTDLFEALKRLRYQISAEEYIAASALFSDATLRDLCRRMPETKKELAAVEGMGLFKANRYGDRMLKLIDRYRNPAAYQPWTPEEDERLRREVQKQIPIRELAESHRRTRGAILHRLKKLGLLLLALALLQTWPGRLPAARAETVGNVRELAELIQETAESGAETFSFTCSKGIYELWTNEEFRSRLLCFFGLTGYSGRLITTGGGYRIEAATLDYMAGAKIWAWYSTGRSEELSRREWDTLAAALEIAARAEGSTLEKERMIHDELCRRIRYGNDGVEQNEDDCAVGALLGGVANCDGYSDAFFLTGRLAGLKVQYFSGWGAAGTGEEAGHMWNLIHIRGQWVMVDLTWDDTGIAGSGDQEGCSWLWYNRGSVSMALDHLWPEEAEEWVNLCREDWPELMPEGFRYLRAASPAEAAEWIDSLAAEAPAEIAIRFDAPTARILLGGEQEGLMDLLSRTRLEAPFTCTYNGSTGLVFLRNPRFDSGLVSVRNSREMREALAERLPEKPAEIRLMLAGDFDWQAELDGVQRYGVERFTYTLYGERRLTLTEIRYRE